MSASFTPELKKMLAAADCYLERQGKGDHEIWYSPITFALMQMLILTTIIMLNWSGKRLKKSLYS